jgi:hypothetical protein
LFTTEIKEYLFFFLYMLLRKMSYNWKNVEKPYQFSAQTIIKPV